MRPAQKLAAALNSHCYGEEMRRAYMEKRWGITSFSKAEPDMIEKIFAEVAPSFDKASNGWAISPTIYNDITFFLANQEPDEGEPATPSGAMGI